MTSVTYDVYGGNFTTTAGSINSSIASIDLIKWSACQMYTHAQNIIHSMFKNKPKFPKRHVSQEASIN